MAGTGWILGGHNPSRRGVMLLLVLALATFVLPSAGRTLAQVADPRLGDSVPYYGPEGDEVATVAVEEIVDPFRGYDQNSPPVRGNHFVLLRVVVVNTAERPLQVDPAAVALQDTLGFLSFPLYVNRGPEATEIDPDLTYGEVPPGGTVRGVVLFQVINGAELARVVYQPSRDRLVVLADLRRETDEGQAVGETLAPSDAAPGGATAVPSGDAAVYENAAFGFRLAYDAGSWEASESADGLTLTNGVSTVQVTGSDVLPTQATTCVDEVAADLAMTSSRQSYALVEGDDGQPAREGNAEAAFAIFGFTGRSGEERFEQITCVALPGARGVVLFLQNGPLPSIVAETTAAEALLNGLSFSE